MSFPPVTHVIFDFDGLLVDTEPIYTKVNTAMLAKYGKIFTMEHKKGQMGRKNEEAIAWLLNEVGLSDVITVEEYAQDYDVTLEKLFRKAPAMPGAEQLVRHLVKHNIPVAICTGSCSRTFMQKAESHLDWVDLIPLKVMTGDDVAVKRGKPFPDGFIETMKRFANPPSSPSCVLVFEDAPNGVRAALDAGMQCVMVPDKQFQPEGEFRAEITQILDCLENFEPQAFGLPAFA